MNTGRQNVEILPFASFQGRALRWSILVVGVTACAIAQGDESNSQPGAVPPRNLKVPDGFAIERVAGPPLVNRPITAAFDDEGRLYVADSSGSNDPVKKQLEERPHRIVRLEDTNGDGQFDRSGVFADRMMFPEGTMFYEGSLYVSAPPSIWKLTDTDGDGVADKREEWFQGQTLTNCANDLHGPYLGPDGWIYWCKGFFGEQTHTVNQREWKTRAAHVMRCRPDGSGLEPVMTGGMDNPVDVVFTPAGERIFTSTFLVHPSKGQRDGLGHAIYGGVHGKDHGAIEGHPRTGDLMPVLVHLGAAAPCGLERYDASLWGPDYRDSLFACQFNHRKVSRHVLRPEAGSFVTDDHEFVSSEDVDFHPTDVLMDADGSVLIVDTGGWYKLCCPTSQLWKPDVLGGIYRVRKTGAARVEDPRGKQIKWNDLDLARIWNLFEDERPVVRQRATREFVTRRESVPMEQFLADLSTKPTGDVGDNRPAALARVWALGQLNMPASQSLVRACLQHSDGEIRQAALQLVSLHRDDQATPQLVTILSRDEAINRRLAAEALGRIGKSDAVPQLLAAAEHAKERLVQHAIIFAMIELGDAKATRTGLASASPRVQAAALVALDQMPGGGLRQQDVVPLLDSPDLALSSAANWIIAHHAEWGPELAQWFQSKLASVNDAEAESRAPSLESLLIGFAAQPAIQEVLATSVKDSKFSPTARKLALRVMARSKPAPTPQAWLEAITEIVCHADPDLLAPAVGTARELSVDKPDSEIVRALLAVADNEQQPIEVRVQALATITAHRPNISPAEFDLLLECFSGDRPVALRSAAADAISAAPLSPDQLARICDVAKAAGPLELHRLLSPFARSTDEQVGLKLLSSLRNAVSLSALRVEILREVLAKYSPAVQEQIDQVHALVNVDLQSQRNRIAELLPYMAKGDVRRGHAVFHSSKAACSACHQMGYAGGIVGPDLSRIGETRTERDLLESIVFPSLSFVRSFEPVVVVTSDGRTINGLIRNETAAEVTLATGPGQEVRLARDIVEEVHPSSVSVMPAGLDKQLSVQELADLVTFLKTPTKQ